MNRLLSLLASLALCSLLVLGCGDDDDSKAAASGAKQVAETETTAKPTTTEATETTTTTPAKTVPAKPVTPPGRTYSENTAQNLPLSPATKTELHKLAQASKAAVGMTLQAPRPGDSYLAGLGAFEYAEASYQYSEHTFIQFLFRRTSKPIGAWQVQDSSTASDVSFPCSLPAPLLTLWHPEFGTRDYCA